MIPKDKIVNFWCAHGKSHGHGQNIMGVPVTVAMGNAYYVFFVPMVIATGMPMTNGMGMPINVFFVPMVIATGMPMTNAMGVPMTMCTGTSTIGKHASWGPLNDSFWPQNAIFGAPGGLGGPRVPDLAPTAADWSIRIGNMFTTHFGLVSSLFWAPWGPKRASFGPTCPF